jgi:hypothetical protein
LHLKHSELIRDASLSSSLRLGEIALTIGLASN